MRCRAREQTRSDRMGFCSKEEGEEGRRVSVRELERGMEHKDVLACRPWRNWGGSRREEGQLGSSGKKTRRGESENSRSNLVLLERLLDLLEVGEKSN